MPLNQLLEMMGSRSLFEKTQKCTILPHDRRAQQWLHPPLARAK